MGDEQRRVEAGRIRRRVEQHVHAGDEPAAADLEPLDRAGVGDRVEPCGRLVLRPFDDRLVAERAGRAQWVRRVGQEAPVDRRAGTPAVDVRRARSRGARRRRASRTAGRAAGARPPARAPPRGSRGRDRAAVSSTASSRTRGGLSAVSWVGSGVRGSCTPGDAPVAVDGCAAPRSPRALAAASRRTATVRPTASRPRAPRGSRSRAPDRGCSRRSGSSAAISSTSPNVCSRSASQSCSSRIPGVSRMTPPAASRISSRCVVVCRPRWSSSRTSFVASSSSPASAFTIVDLPTPDEPSRTAVRFGSSHGRSCVEPRAGLRRHGERRARAERDRLDLVEVRRDVVDEVGLRQQDDRLRAALPRHREVALEPAHVEVERQRLDEERDVDVRGEHLLARRVPHLLARDRRAALEHRLDEVRRRGRRRPSRRRPAARRS